MAGPFDWISSELRKMKLFRFPSGHNKLKGAQFALLGQHNQQLAEQPGSFSIPSEIRKKLRDVWITQEMHEGKPVVLVHALALARTDDVEKHAAELEEKVEQLRQRFSETGIRARFHVSTYLNGVEPDNHIEQYLKEYHAPFSQHVAEMGFSLHGLHSVVMRLEAAPGMPEGHLEQVLEALKQWKAGATLESLRAPIRNKTIGSEQARASRSTVRISERTKEEKMKEAQRRRLRKEGRRQTKFDFMKREPIHRLIA